MMMKPIEERITGRKAKDVYKLIRKSGTVSKINLLEQSGMTVSTLTRMLDDLAGQGLIEEVGLGESTGGRRPKLYRTNPRYAYVFGLDVSRTYSRLILCDMHLNKLDAYAWPMTVKMTPEVFIREAVQQMRRMLEEQGICIDQMLGIGVGAVGPLDRSRGVILEPLHFPAPGWQHVPICEMLQHYMHLPVVLDNGANAALLGEYWSEGAEQFQHVLYIHNGVGLRSAVMTNAEIVYGAVDMEGAIGQMIIQTDGLPPRNPGGNYGSLEAYVTMNAMEQTAQQYLKQGRTSVMLQWVKSPEHVRFADLLRALQQKDMLVTEIFTQAATYFGIGLANLLNILHPEKVILGGPVFNSHDIFFRVATQVAVQKTYYYPDYQVVFSRGRLGEEALATGAAAMVINRMTDYKGGDN